MRTKKHLLLGFCLALLASLVAFTAVACGGNDDTARKEDGSYYSYVNNEKDGELVFDKGTYTLNFGGNELSGKYSLKNDAFSVKINEEEVTLTYKDDIVTFEYDGNDFAFYKDVEHTVSFSVEDGSQVSPVKIKKGQYLAELDTLDKFGFAFDGWYLDNKYQTKYVLNETVIVADTTLYAHFVNNEYTVTFVTGGSEVIADRLTTANALAELPTPQSTGAKFLGWWVSDTQKPDKLTYQYNAGDKLNANTKLFAVYESDKVAISVKDNRITLTSKGANKNYSVKVTSAVGDVWTRGGTQTEYTYNFNAQGEYKIEVTVDDETSTAYYTPYLLPRVSFMQAKDGVLTFAPVDGAEDYYLSFVCGNEAHRHENLKLDKGVYTFDYSGCVMVEGGLKFTVRAEAKGKDASVSDELVLEKELSVENVHYVSADDTVEWDANAAAASYRVEITTKDDTYVINTGLETHVSLKNYTGSISVKVFALANGYFSKPATATVEKSRLATPAGLKLDNTALTWDAVAGAASYNVKIGNNDVRNVTAPRFALSLLGDYNTDVELYVQAVAEGTNRELDSFYSEPVTLKYAELDAVRYDRGVLSWNYIRNAKKFVVKINDGDEIDVPAGQNSFEVEFTQSGENVVGVSYYNTAGEQSEWKTVTITVYELTFHSEEDDIILYKAKGDKLTLPVVANTEKEVFAGWYDKEGGPEVNAAKYENEYFEDEADREFYAYYTTAKYKVQLVIDSSVSTVETTEKEIRFGERYTLPVPTHEDTMNFFDGWFSEVNGVGRRYTDKNGVSTDIWYDTLTVKLYPRWIAVLNYTLRPDGNSYSVRKGAAISLVNEVIIPKEYNGKPVTMIEAGAFVSCSNINSIKFYDTMEIVDLGLGGMGTNSAFQGCDNLQKITVLETENNTDPVFQDVDGVLFRNNPNNNNGIELYFYPAAKETTVENPYEIPYGVRVIPVNTFKNYRLFKAIKIPATVERIDSEAFAYCYQLYSVEFLDDPAEKPTNVFKFDVDSFSEASQLNISALAFMYCNKVVSIELPSRFDEDITFNNGSENYGDEGSWDIFKGCSALKQLSVKAGNSKYQNVTVTVGKETYKMLADNDKKIVYAPRAVGQGLEENAVFRIPSGITAIGQYAFADAFYLKNVAIPGYVTTIEDKAFLGATRIATLTFEGTAEDADLTIGNKAFAGICATELVMPKNLKEIKAGAFALVYKESTSQGLKMATTVTERNVELDGRANAVFANGAFEGVTSLTLGATIPADFSISGVFTGNTLQSVDVVEGGNFESEEGVLYNSGKTAILYYPSAKVGNFEIKESVTEIGVGVFENKSISEITFHNKITKIGANAFKDCAKLSKVTFDPNGTEYLTIGENAFKGCVKLEKIALPERTTVIGDSAFEGCTQLANVSIPSTVTKMGTYDANGVLTSINVFKDCTSLSTLTVAPENANFGTASDVLYRKTNGVVTELVFAPTAKSGIVDIPKTITKIWDNAFKGNTKITEVKFSEGLNDGIELVISNSAFENATGLTTVTLVDGVVKIGQAAFKGCSQLNTVHIPVTVTIIDKNAFNDCVLLTTVDFKDVKDNEEVVGSLSLVQNSWDGVFKGCTALEELVFPKRLTSLDTRAFYQQAALRTVEFKGNVSSLGQYAFSQATMLEEVIMPSTSTLTILDNNLFQKTNLRSFVMPNSVTTINQSVFEECPLDKGITFSTRLLTIGNSAFANNALTSLTIPETVTKIDRQAFYKNPFSWDEKIVARFDTLKTLTFPAKGNIEIVQDAFKGNTGLKSVVIQGVNKIGQEAFRQCTDLSSVTFNDGKCATIEKGAFYQTALTTFTFPTLAEGSLTLGTGLFEKCGDLQTVKLSKSVTSIDGLFNGCISIKTIEVDSENENFGVSKDYTMILFNKAGTAIRLVFGQLPLQSGTFEIMDGMTTISANSFVGQNDIQKLIIPASVTHIEEAAFKDLIGLETVEFKGTSKLVSIGNNAFNGCTSLKNFTVPATVNTIGEGAFNGCKNLTEVVLPSGITEIKKNTFKDCAQLARVVVAGSDKTAKFVLPASVATIGEYAFTNTGLTEVTLGSAVTTINRNAFSDCAELLTANVNTKYDTIGIEVFKNCAKLSNVKLNSKITQLGNAMFDSCKSLSGITLPEDLQFLGTGTFKSSGLTSIVIPNLVQHIGTSFGSAASASGNVDVFNGCTKLREVTLPTGLISMGGGVFNGCSMLTDIKLPSSLNTIGQYCFQGTEISKLDLSNVTTFGNYTFYNCKSLTDVTFNNNVTTLPTYMFSGCSSLESITLPTSATSIPSNFFADCVSLKTVNFPDNLTTIAGYSFSGCIGLKSITIPASVQTFGGNYSYLFYNCTGLETVIFEGDTVATFYGGAFRGCTSLKNVTLPARLQTVTGSNGLFDGCTSLVEIELPNTLTTIQRSMFKGCTSLEKVRMSNDVTSIGSSAFEGCVNLRDINFPTELTTIDGSAFSGCRSLDNVTLPDKLTSIGGSAFKGTGLTSIVIPERVSSLGSNAFQDAASLETVRFVTNRITSIGTNVFENCVSLTEVELQDTLTKIDQYAFRNSGLSEITLPANLREIKSEAFCGTKITTLNLPAYFNSFEASYYSSYSGYSRGHAFYGMNELTDINVDENNMTFVSKNGVLYNRDTDALVIYPNGRKGSLDLSDVTSLAESALDGCLGITDVTLPSGWTEVPKLAFARTGITSVTIPEGYTSIAEAAFRGLETLTEVNLPSTLKTIGETAFRGVAGLTQITLPEGLETIGGSAFYETGLTQIHIPESVTKLGSSAFYGCANLTAANIPSHLDILESMMFYNTALTSIEVPASVKKIGSSAFQGTEGLKNVTLHEGLEVIDSSTFYGSGITEITLPASLKNFSGSQVFYNCKSLETVRFLGNTQFKYKSGTSTYNTTSVFAGCEVLKNVTLPEGLENLPDNTFNGCTGLERITLPDTIASMGESVFSGCTSLDEVKLPAALKKIANKTFENCESLKTVNYGDNVTEIGNNVFLNCVALTTFTLKTGLKTLGSNVFENCTLSSITIPATVSSVGSNLVKGWTSAQTVNVERTAFEASLWTASWSADSEAKIVWGYTAK